MFRLRPLWLNAFFFTRARTKHIVGSNFVDRIVARVAVSRIGLASLGLFSLPAIARDGERIAGEQGCLNCHYSQSRSSPTLQRLADKLATWVRFPSPAPTEN